MTFLYSGFSRAEAQRLQKEAKSAGSSGAVEIVQEQRPALKFGFGAKPVASKVRISYYQYLSCISSCFFAESQWELVWIFLMRVSERTFKMIVPNNATGCRRLFLKAVFWGSENRYPDLCMCSSQMSMGLATKKTKVVSKVASVFKNDSDEET